MAEVSIDIDAMSDLVDGLRTAGSSLTTASGTLKGNLTDVWLSTGSLSGVGALEEPITTAIRDLNRRLALARMIQLSTPGLSVITFDDSVLSTASAAEVERRVNQVLELMAVDEDDFDPRDIDSDLLDLLSENSLDPYFAKGLADRLSPEGLDQYLRLVNDQRMWSGDGGEGGLQAFDQRYDQLLRGLGETLSLATRGTGEVGAPAMTSRWTDFIEQPTAAMTGGVNRLALVLERGQWSDAFMTGVYRSMREVEKGRGADAWTSAGLNFAFDPDPEGSTAGRLMEDPMYGVLRAMQHNPGAVRELFTAGATTDIETGNGAVSVNRELYDFLRHRDGTSDETAEAFIEAMVSAVGSPPLEGTTAFQPLLAQDLTHIGEALQHEADQAAEEAGPLWKQIGHGLLDLAGMVPVVGEPADFVNGLWYYADGDVINGSLSMGGVIPFVGWAAVGGKWTKRALSAQELARLNRLARNGENVRIFTKGRHLDSADLTLPETFAAERFLSPDEIARWSGNREFMRKVIAGNRFNDFLNPRYAYNEIPLTTGNKAPFRLDSYTPGEAIVSRKLTQLGDISVGTAKRYLDEFVRKYPAGTRIADTPKTRELGISGRPLEGEMIFEVPPQTGGTIPRDIIKYAEDHDIFIRDLNGHFYTEAP